MPKVTAVTKEEVDNCPVRQVLAKVTGKWQILILFALGDGAVRFGALKRAVGDITQRVLTENLRSLERDGHITRTVDGGPPLSVHYELTEMGHELLGHFASLTDWAARNHDSVRQARALYDQA